MTIVYRIYKASGKICRSMLSDRALNSFYWFLRSLYKVYRFLRVLPYRVYRFLRALSYKVSDFFGALSHKVSDFFGALSHKVSDFFGALTSKIYRSLRVFAYKVYHFLKNCQFKFYRFCKYCIEQIHQQMTIFSFWLMRRSVSMYRFLRAFARQKIQQCKSYIYWLMQRTVLWLSKKILDIDSIKTLIPDNQSYNGHSKPITTKKKCRLVICCAFTGRYQVLAASIRESLYSKYGPEIEWFLCGSTKEDALFIEAMKNATNRVSGFICANNPLGRKWQQCISFAGDYYDAQLYAIAGSDDILSSGLINFIIEQEAHHDELKNRKQKPALYGTTNWLTMVNDQANFANSQIFQCNILESAYYQPIGAGRFYTGAFLKKINFRIFDVRLERLLDDFGYAEVKRLEQATQLYTVEEGALISVKGSWSQLNTVKDFINAKTLDLTEFSYKGFDLIHKNCSLATCDFLFKQNDLARQLSFPRDKPISMDAA